MSGKSRTRRTLRSLVIAAAGAAVALAGVLVVRSRSSGATDVPSPRATPTTVAAPDPRVGWLAAVPFCVVFLRWTQTDQSIDGTAQAADPRHHRSWSLPIHGSVDGSHVDVEVGAPGLCGSRGTRMTGTVSSDSLSLDFEQPLSTTGPITFQKAGLFDFNLARAAARAHRNSTGSATAPTSLVSAVTSVPHRVFSQVGRGNATQPAKLAAPLLANPDGRPRIVWIGGEYCASCASARWPLVVALSRFGTFTDLRVTTSTALDGNPNTRSFSFYGSTYTSPYITFEAVEQFTNIPVGTGYTRLDTMTPDQQQLFDKFDKPPYVDPSSRGSLPFVDFANQYSIVGAPFSPAVLRGLNADSIAVALFDPTTDVAKGVIGSANEITAAICKITQDQPIDVCSDGVVQAIEGQLG